MSVLPTHREQDWKLALDNCRKNNMQGEPKYLEMDIVWDLDTQFGFNTTVSKIASGDVIRKKLFLEIGMEVCKKTDATLLIIIGEKSCGCWLIGKCKNYWLKPIKQYCGNNV